MSATLFVLIALLPTIAASSFTCDKAVGIENGLIPDDALTASSQYSRWQRASQGRLNKVKSSDGEGAWCAIKADVLAGTAYIQVDLGSMRYLGNLLTQGRNTTYDQYVKSYKVSFSTDGANYTFIPDTSTGQDKVYISNSNMNSIVSNSLVPASGVPLQARYVRIYALSFHGNPCMRIEIQSCTRDITCPSGYKLSQNKQSCVDIDECSADPKPCDTFSSNCVNTIGSYTCQCKSGFKTDPTSSNRCLDIDECHILTHRCAHKCVNTQGSYTCVCNNGYKLNSDGLTCSDINECSVLNPTHHCDKSTTTCSNTVGGYNCTCVKGYERQDRYTCKDKDECRNGEAQCDLPSSYCINQPGTYHCLCRRGYERPQGAPLDPLKCQDVDECATNNGVCTHGCQNKPGSYDCTCPAGYQISTNDRYTCVDTNECLVSNGKGNCEHNCHNSVGSYTCSCKPGFKLDGKYKCPDIDECTDGSSQCDTITTNCQNNQPFYQCNCKPGFRPLSGNSYKCEAKTCQALSVASGTVVSPAGCSQNGGAYVGILCSFSCQAGYQLPQGSNNNAITCQDSGQWSGVVTSCTKRSCPALPAPSDGAVEPDFCATRGNVYQSSCYFKCNIGFTPTGTTYRTCQADGAWTTMQTQFSCQKVYPAPTIICPADVTTTLSVGAGTADLSALLDPPKSNVKQITVSPAKYQSSYIFPAGLTELTYTATNQNGKSLSCKTLVNVIDNEKPKVTGCPEDIYKTITGNEGPVTWTPPTFTDNVGIASTIYPLKNPGDMFGLDPFTATYIAKDAMGNKATCSFRIDQTKAECIDPPHPDGGKLTISSFNGYKFASITCDPNKALFQYVWSISCDVKTLKWGVIPDCVDFITKPVNGCPSGMIPQKLPQYPPQQPQPLCVKCPKGTFYNAAAKSCDACKVGMISTSEGSLACTPCPSGESTLKEGSKTCTGLCEPGSASVNGFKKGSQQCDACRHGKYDDRTGSTSCKTCPTGLTTLILGSKSVADCGGTPSISEFMSTPVNATEHQPVDVICRGDGIPAPSFKVKKIKPAPDNFGGPVKVTTINDVNNKVLGLKHTITKVTEHDAGFYICEVENSFGLAKKYYHLNVQLVIGAGRRRR